MLSIDIHGRRTLLHIAMVAFIAAIIGAEQTVFAQSVNSAQTCRVAAETLVIDGNVSTSFRLTVQRGSSAVVEVPSGIKDPIGPRDVRFRVVFSPDDTKMYVIPRKPAEVGDTYSGRLRSNAGFDIGFRVVVINDEETPRDALRLLHRSEKQRLDALAAALALAKTQPVIQAERKACEKRTREAVKSRESRGLRRVALQGLGQQPVYPRIDRKRQSTGPLYVEFTHAQWGKGVLLAFFFIENRGSKPQRVETIAIFDHEDIVIPTEHVYLADVLNQRDSNFQAIIAGKYEPESAPLIGGKYLLDRTLVKDERVNGVIAIPVPVDSDYNVEPYAVRLYSGRGKPTAESGLEGWTTMRPVYKEEVERNRRAKQVALSVRGVFGGFWTDDAVAGTELVDGTTMTGLSVRFTKGMHHNFAFEVDIIGGRTGEARFVDAEWENMQGLIARQAKFGRLQGSGVLRFGQRYVVSMRLGIGVQGSSYDSVFTSGSMSEDGPGGSFEVDGVWSVGGSFDALLGERWSVGASAGFADGFNTDFSSIEAGVHVGYRWNP